MARPGEGRIGSAVSACSGRVWCVRARLCLEWQSRYGSDGFGSDRIGWERQVVAVLARMVMVRKGKARTGGAGQ